MNDWETDFFIIRPAAPLFERTSALPLLLVNVDLHVATFSLTIVVTVIAMPLAAATTHLAVHHQPSGIALPSPETLHRLEQSHEKLISNWQMQCM